VQELNAKMDSIMMFLSAKPDVQKWSTHYSKTASF
jgi:hypothetical protein